MKRSKRPNRYSLSKIRKLNDELPERIKLIERCGGKPQFYTETFKRNDGSVHKIKRVRCIGGRCEICGELALNGEFLEPHETPKRSAGGKVSLKDSVMCHRSCHREQHSKPQLEWIR